MSRFIALVASYVLVASLGWTNGYIVGRLLERRLRDELESWAAPLTFVDLTEPAPAYDWAVDGEAAEVQP